MDRLSHGAAVWALLMALVAAASLSPKAAAQEGPPTPPRVTPPRLIEGVRAEYPEAERGDPRPASVTLVITIGLEGEVMEVSVGESGGEAFDQAALEAARRFRFAPATRDGAPIAARIRFRYDFEPPPTGTEAGPGGPEAAEPEPPVEPPPAPPPGRLEGRVLEGEAPIAGAEVLVTEPETTITRRAVTDEEGRYAFAGLAPGAYRVRVTAEGYAAAEEEESVRGGEATALTYRLDRADSASFGERPDPEAFGATATIDAPAREVTRRSIPAEVLTRVPGTRGDALRAIELLPGVGRPSLGPGGGTGGGPPPGQVLIRGSAPGDSEVFLNGVSVPLLYHFGGITSFYQSRLLNRIDFYPGNFSTRFGRRVGGIVEVEPRAPRRDGYHGLIDINVIDASLILEAPLGDRASIAVAGRRSYLDTFFAEVVPDGVFNVVAAPVYYDYQLVFQWDPTNEDRLRLFVYGSGDEFNVVFADPSDNDPAIRGNFDLRTEFHRVQAEWRHVFSEDLVQDITLSGGYTRLLFAFGPLLKFDSEFVPLALRSEWRWRVSDQVRLIAGLDWTYTPVDLEFLGNTSRQSEGAPNTQDPNATSARTDFRAQTNAYRPAVYVEADLQPEEDMQVVVGARLDYFRDIGSWAFNPRLAARWTVVEQVVVKYGVGLFSQPPAFQESADGVGNPELGATHAVHISGGAEWRPDRQWRVEVEGYYKHLWDRVVGTEGGAPPFFTNDGIGRIYGLEVSLRAEPVGRFFGFLSYSLSRSERSDRGGPWRLFDFDQTHILTLAVVGRLGDGWEAGATFRLVSGNPYTPVTGAFYNAAADIYQPIYGPVNSERNPFFHRLDLRLEKSFRIEDWGQLAIYLDIQNTYNATNRSGLSYNYNYTQFTEIPGLPIIPSLGIRGSL